MDDNGDPGFGARSSGGCFGNFLGCVNTATGGNAAGVCIESEGTVAETSWNYVGDGRGSYRRVPNYSYVGSGQGTYDMDQLPVYYGYRLRPSCVCFFGLLALLIVCCIYVLHPQGAAAATTTLRAVALPAQSYGCLAEVAPSVVDAAWRGSDGDEDGTVTRSELWEAERLGHLSANVFIAMRSADVDGNQVLSAAEFGAGMAKAASLDTHSWSLEKRLWCCERRGIGCAPPSTLPMTTTSAPYRCDTDPEYGIDGWSYARQDWCCRYQGKLCQTTTPPVYECRAGADNWERGWSPHKKAWCCDEFGAGCPSAVTATPYDCGAGYSNWENGWSSSKKEWCCSHLERGCGTMVVTTTTLPYDCQAGYTNWQQGWSDSKKQFCCARLGRGCPTVTPCPETKAVIYNCNLNYATADEKDHFIALWSDEKKEWCCKYAGIGCTTTTSLPYDCDVGAGNWPEAWSNLKRAWCCDDMGQGCTTTGVPTAAVPCPTVGPIHECSYGDSSTWAPEKQRWCCTSQGIGCTTTTVTTTSAAVALFCSSFACPASATAKDSATALLCDGTACTTSRCCVQLGRCSDLTCPSGRVPRPSVGDLLCGGAVCSMAADGTWCCAERALCSDMNCAAGFALRDSAADTLCKGPSCVPELDAQACCRQVSAPATCDTLTCPKGYFPRENRKALSCAGAACRESEDKEMCCNQALSCNLNCYGQGASPVKLSGATGDGDVALNGLTIDQCRDKCIATDGCEGVVFGGGQCFGRRDIHTSKCQTGGGDIRTEVLRTLPWGKCVMVGDPHILTFDRPLGPMLDALVPGEYRMIESSSLEVHARFGYTERFPEAASWLGLAVGGKLIDDHHLAVSYVGPGQGHAGFRLAWDHKEFFADKTKKADSWTSDDGVLKATYGEMDPSEWHREARHTIGGTSGKIPAYSFHLKPDIHIYVLIGPDNGTCIMEMRKLPGSQDGLCGNFNCDPHDDAMAALENRGLAAAIDPAESLFKFAVGPRPPANVMTPVKHPVSTSDIMDNCPATVKAQASKLCAALEGAEKRACIVDACAAKDVSVVKASVAAGALEQDVSRNN